jgi:hypothetical protein
MSPGGAPGRPPPNQQGMDNGPPSSPPTMALAPMAPGSPGMPSGGPQYPGPGLQHASTMALPQSAFEPPPGMGQQGMPGMPQGAGYAQMSSGPGGFPGMQNMQGMSAQAYPSRGMGEHYPPPPAVMTPAAIPPQQAGSSKKIFAIVGGVVGVGVLAALITVFVVKPGHEEPTGPVAISSGSGSPAEGTPPAPTAPTSAAPPATPDPPPDPTTSASAAPEAPPGPTTVAVTIVCKPECDAVKIDGKRVDFSKPVELAPGIHSVEAQKAGHLPRVERFDVKAGEPLEKVLELAPAPANPNPNPNPKPKCQPGQFIKKCK